MNAYVSWTAVGTTHNKTLASNYWLMILKMCYCLFSPIFIMC